MGEGSEKRAGSEQEGDLSTITRSLTIRGFGYGGEGFARTDEGFVSVPRALPGERVVARVGPSVRGRAWAEVVDWEERSPRRVEPDCPHFAWPGGTGCNGCALRHLSRDDERALKLDWAREVLEKYGPTGVLEEVGAIGWLGGEGRLGHRARGRFSVEWSQAGRRPASPEARPEPGAPGPRGARRDGPEARTPGCQAGARRDGPEARTPGCQAGARRDGPEARTPGCRAGARRSRPTAPSVHLGLRSVALDRSIVDIRDCPAQNDRFRWLMAAVGSTVASCSDDLTLTAVTIETAGPSPDDGARITLHAGARPSGPLLDGLLELAESENTALLLQVDTDGTDTLDVLRGSAELRLRQADLVVRAPPGAWHHAAPALGHLLADWVAERVAALGSRRVLDLCCGLGTLTARLAPMVDWMLAVDEHRPSVEALRSGLIEAGLDHVECRAGRIGAVLRKLRRDPAARADLAVINPMRRPLGQSQLRDLSPIGVDRVIYLGPAPVSAARDATTLAELGFRVTGAMVVDLHPGTAQTMLALELRRAI